MYQSPELECVINQDCWFSSETKMADIILPACTNFERDDIGEWAGVNGYTVHGSNGCNYRYIVREKKCIEPLGESKSDYQIFTDICERLGMKEKFTDGKTEVDWCKKFFEVSDLAKTVSWEEFDKKGYHIINAPENYKSTPSLRWFHDGRPCDTPDQLNPKRCTDKANEVATYSGKIEFASQSLKENFPDDDERPVVPHYIESWEGHKSALTAKYPLQMLSPHPRFTFHVQYDDNTDWLEDIPGHRITINGYSYWPARIHHIDAEARGIKNHDLVKLYNDRASVICVAVITERVRPGVIHAYCSASKYDPMVPGDSRSTDRGGCVATLTSSRMVSKNVPGMTPNSCLIEVEKWEG
jgi:trimethylamine-N-oxide reductase (cytochrome c)